jgi:hypothetical protein
MWVKFDFLGVGFEMWEIKRQRRRRRGRSGIEGRFNVKGYRV